MNRVGTVQGVSQKREDVAVHVLPSRPCRGKCYWFFVGSLLLYMRFVEKGPDEDFKRGAELSTATDSGNTELGLRR